MMSNLTQRKGKTYPCKTCGKAFETPQELGTHVYSTHPEARKPRSPRHGPRRMTRQLAVEVTVRMKAEPTEMMRIEIPSRTVEACEETYRALCKYIANRPTP